MKVEIGRLDSFKSYKLNDYILEQYESFNPLSKESYLQELFEKLALYININGIVAAGVKPEDLIIERDPREGIIIYYVCEEPDYEKIEEIKSIAKISESSRND